MRPVELVARAAAHGIDLKAVAGNASNIDGDAAPRRLSRAERRQREEDHLSPYVMLTARGTDTRVYRRPAYTHAEVGQAGCGCPRMPWLAACYSFAGDTSGYTELHRGLTVEAIKFAEREEWPWRVRKINGAKSFYLEQLSELVLDVAGNARIFLEAPRMFAICMDVTDDVWSATLAQKYATLSGKFERWLGVAQGQIARWITAEESGEAPDASVYDASNPAPFWERPAA